MRIPKIVREFGEYLSNKGPVVAVMGLYTGIYVTYFDTL